MEGISDPQLSPEDLRLQLEDPPSLDLSHNRESVRENPTAGPHSEDITITEEALQEDKETASEETRNRSKSKLNASIHFIMMFYSETLNI